jgi:hypothetical protein
MSPAEKATVPHTLTQQMPDKVEEIIAAAVSLQLSSGQKTGLNDHLV